MFDRFTERARKIMSLALQEAQRFNHDYIGTEHRLLGLVQEGRGVGARVLKRLDIELKTIRIEVEKRVAHGTSMVTFGQLPFTPRAKVVLECCLEEAQHLGHNYIGSEHLLLGLIREEKGIAAAALGALGVRVEWVREQVVELLEHSGDDAMDDPRLAELPGPSKTPALDLLGRDLSAQAREGLFEDFVGRRDEIRRTLRTLARLRGNNPLLVGPAGAGKTAIVEELARLTASGDATDPLRGMRIVEVDASSLVAGTRSVGQFAERLQAVLRETRRSGDILLFLPDLHRAADAGSPAHVAELAAGLKPVLRRGEIQCIGAMTLAEHDGGFARDPALSRHFQFVEVQPLPVEDSHRLIARRAGLFATHHAVTYDDSALRLAVDLAATYVTDRALPDSALDLVDEAGTWARSEGASVVNDDVMYAAAARRTGLDVADLRG